MAESLSCLTANPKDGTPIHRGDLRDTYRAYLVRLWRVSAQLAESGKVIRFADLKALNAFLNAQASDSEASGAIAQDVQ